MKKIFFSEINFLNIFVIFLFKIIGFKVYFLKIDKKIRNKTVIKILKKLGICWFDYQTYVPKTSWAEVQHATSALSDLYAKEITDKIWCSRLELIFFEKQNLQVCFRDIFWWKHFLDLCELFELAKQLVNENQKIYLWAPDNFFSRKVFQESKNVINLCPRYVTYLKLFFNLILQFFNLIFSKLITKSIFSIFKKNKNIENGKKTNSKFEIAYFPHYGIVSKNYKKDQFYSKEKTSPFYFSKILHIDWSKEGLIKLGNKMFEENEKFYKDKNITVNYWNAVKGNSKRQIFKKIINSIKILFDLAKKINIEFILNIIIFSVRIENNLKKLSHYPNLKIVLIGYEQNFPTTLAVACRIKNIKLIATQERSIRPYHGFQYLIDKYFVFGTESKNFFLNKKIDKKMEISELGITTMYHHLNEKKDLKIENSEKFDLKCLVMGTHTDIDWYLNGRRTMTNWRKVMSFYEKIILLAKKNQKILFLIKTKNYKWMDIPYFKDFLKKINVIQNIKILNDQIKWTPTNCLANTDFGIAIMSRLADEMLAIGKPVIIFNNESCSPNIAMLNYGSNIIADNFEDLEIKVEQIKTDIKKYNNNLDPVRNKFFKKLDKNFFMNQLEKIADEFLENKQSKTLSLQI